MSMKTTHPFAWVLKACYTAEISLYCRGVLLSMRGSGLVLPYGAAFVGCRIGHNYMWDIPGQMKEKRDTDRRGDIRLYCFSWINM